MVQPWFAIPQDSRRRRAAAHNIPTTNTNRCNVDMMNPISAKTGLEEPLLAGAADEHEELVELVDDDEENEAAAQGDDDESPGGDLTITFGTSCWDYVCIFLVVPSLLWLQFAVALNSGRAADLTGCSVLLTILLFTTAGYMYKCCLSDHDFSHRTLLAQQALLLLPEILMDVILMLVLLGPASMAFEALLYCTMALAFFVIISTVVTLRKECCYFTEQEKEGKEAAACYVRV
jgi:hypothetical protein